MIQDEIFEYCLACKWLTALRRALNKQIVCQFRHADDVKMFGIAMTNMWSVCDEDYAKEIKSIEVCQSGQQQP
jgi:hypothetical protein